MVRILWQDILICIGFLLYFGAGFSTRFILAEVGKYTDAANQLESNPIARQTLNFGYSIFMLQVLEIAFIGSIYYLVRRRINADNPKLELDRQLLSFYSIAMFLIFLQNFLNDYPIALKIFMGGN